MKVRVHIHKEIEIEVTEPVFEDIVHNGHYIDEEKCIGEAINIIEEKTGLKCYDYDERDSEVEYLVACYTADKHEYPIFET